MPHPHATQAKLSDNQYYVFENEDDVWYLANLCKRLYLEQRMNADDMRDAAQRLQILLERLETVTIIA